MQQSGREEDGYGESIDGQFSSANFIWETIYIIYTRSYATLQAADLDWIVGPGYSLGWYILENNHEKQTLNHEKQTLNHEKQTLNHEKPWKPTWNHEKPWKPTWNHEKPTWNYEKPWKPTWGNEGGAERE